MTVMERVNARNLDPAVLPWRPGLITVDVSFISLAKLLGPIVAVGAEDLDLLAMVKPQFELGPERVRQRRGGPGPRRRGATRCGRSPPPRVPRGWWSAASPPPGCPGRRATARPSSGARAGGNAVDLEAAIREVEP